MNIIEFIRNLWKRLFGRTPMAESTIQRKEVQFANEKFLPEIVRLLNEGHTITLPLRGFSMRPFLEDNRDKALFTKPTNPKVGDPVLAEIEPGHFVMHRIIAIDGNAVTLRGDGNLNDEHCLLQNVCGAVIGFYRKGRTRLDRTDGWKWKCYSFVWMRLYPIRRYLLAFYRRIWIKLPFHHAAPETHHSVQKSTK